MADLHIPTDEEISEMIGGVPVFSCKPEDFPHFKPEINASFTQQEIDERTQAMLNFFRLYYPNYSSEGESALSFASMQIAGLNVVVNQGEISGFFLMRPSELISVDLDLAKSLKIPRENVLGHAVPSNDIDFLNVYHEIGHMDCYLKGLHLDSRWKGEIYADMFSFENYHNLAGCYDAVDRKIYERTLGAFLSEPLDYWYAPLLFDWRRGGSCKPEMDSTDCIVNCFEMRFRTADRIMGDSYLDGCDSSQLQEAIVLWANRKADLIIDEKLRETILQHSYTYELLHKIPEKALGALNEIASSPQIDDFARENAHQILEAASHLTVGLLPESVVSRYEKEESSVDTDITLG